LTFFDQFCVFFSQKRFFWAIDHAESEKIVYFNRRPDILKNFEFFQKISKFFFSKFSKSRVKATFLWSFDPKIGILGSFYPYPELGLKKYA
jgi:hypothetical protein